MGKREKKHPPTIEHTQYSYEILETDPYRWHKLSSLNGSRIVATKETTSVVFHHIVPIIITLITIIDFQ